MSFLDKIKTKIEDTEKGKNPQEAPKEGKIPSDFSQLDVDIYENSTEIVIYAPMPGATIDDLDISVEDQNDIITIQGYKNLVLVDVKEKMQLLRQECHWGGFYRQIILPSEIDVNGVQAQLVNGVLTLRLPLLRIVGNGKKKIEVKGDS